MHYSTFTTSDNCRLAFQSSIPLPTTPDRTPTTTTTTTTTNDTPDFTTCILLLHGFSGSSAYFTRNTGPLSAQHWVITPDLRGHGQSGHNPSRGGYHVARLAADLHELITHLRTLTTTTPTTTSTATTPNPSPPTKFIPIGCSISAAILWTYTELFTDAAFAGCIVVDQAPLQDRAALGLGGTWGAGLAHGGCYDEATLLAAQRAWVEEPARARAGLVEGCLGYRVAAAAGDGEGVREVGEDERVRDEVFFTGVSALCDGVWLARLLADHTRYDHREACEGLTRPVLVMAGRRSGCFTLEGMEETVRRARKGGNGDAEMVVFESGHWLFYEEPERFNREVLAFVARCTRHAEPRQHVGRAPFQPDIHLFLALHPHHAQHAGGVGVYPVPTGRAPRYHHQPVPVHDHVMGYGRLPF
ncbi:Alpha/Beta hydrolase protein [Chaetomium fimeti]|uniref:Alpha/Beta hydrolase protein n=1 Tax=Chaetomium fimeti TaxID=1854472 RepID=A0AAE0HEY9_9PEZI|nr:Alpha/Beta hydrolase protein [Chaetomium fimeti]